MPYLDHACLGLPRPEAAAAVAAAAQGLEATAQVSSGTEVTTRWLEQVAAARAAVASLVGGDSADVALVENTTHGLGAVASALPLGAGDNVLVPDCEFLGAATVWRRASRRRGFAVRIVPTRGGVVGADDLRQAADARTRVLVVSAVQEVSGHRADLAALASLAADLGAVLVVDGAQEAGVLRRSLPGSGVGVYAAGGHKWLRSPFGNGFCRVDPAVRDRLDPAYEGYLALPEPVPGWGAYLADRDRTVEDAVELPIGSDAAVLESGGTPNWLGALALTAAVRALLAEGPACVEQRALELADLARTELARAGLRVYGGADPYGRSTVVTFTTPGGPAADAALHKALFAAGVQVSLRGVAGVGGIRVACHATNDEDDVAALVDVARRNPSPLRPKNRAL